MSGRIASVVRIDGTLARRFRADARIRRNAACIGLIDDEGVLLDPQRASKLPLPVLVGIPPEDTESMRRERVKRFLRLQAELGSYMSNISEVDVSDLDNLRVSAAVRRPRNYADARQPEVQRAAGDLSE